MRIFLATLSLILSLSITACDPGSSASGGTTSEQPKGELGEADISPDTTTELEYEDADSASDGSSKFIQGDFTIEKAMEVVYGLYDKNMECSRWICKPREEKAFASKISEEGELYTRPAGVYDVKDNDGNRKMLITETLARGKEGWESCHACAPIVGVAMFMEVEENWYIEALRKDLSEIGAWGEMPEHKLVQIGPQSWGIRLDYGYTNQGITEGGMELLGMAQDRFHVLTNLHTNYSNAGMFYGGESAEGAYSYESEISFEPGDNVEHWDMVMVTKGSKPVGESDEIREFEEVRRFVLKENEYVEVTSAEMSAEKVM